MNFVHSSSEDFPIKFRGFRALREKCRFIHIDSSHSFDTTFHELQMSEHMVASGGIVVLDDFTNLNYSQILAATYKYIYTERTELMPFLVTEEKGYFVGRATSCSSAATFLTGASWSWPGSESMMVALRERISIQTIGLSTCGAACRAKPNLVMAKPYTDTFSRILEQLKLLPLWELRRKSLANEKGTKRYRTRLQA
jgi:hypothetical protein